MQTLRLIAIRPHDQQAQLPECELPTEICDIYEMAFERGHARFAYDWMRSATRQMHPGCGLIAEVLA